jgi:DedD protein
MSLLSSLRKNKQDAAAEDSTFYSRAEEESKAVRRRSKRQDGKDNEPADPVLPEKKRARRRLIGAVALVLAAVIGLPMIFDSEPKPVADDIAIQIPSKDKPASSPAATQPTSPPPSTIAALTTLDPKEEVVDSPAQAQESAQPEATTAKAHAVQLAAAAPAAKDKQESVKPAEPQIAKTETKPELKHEPKSESKPDTKAEAKSAERKAEDAARAKALLEGKPDPAKTADRKTGKFVIQVAALATKEKIDEVQGKLKAGGLKPYTEKVATHSGDRTRIRVGPFASKEEADKAKAKILKLGLNATLLPA